MKVEMHRKYHRSKPRKSGRRSRRKWIILSILVIAIVYFGLSEKERFFDLARSSESTVIMQESHEPEHIATEEDDGEAFITHIVSDGDIPADVFSEHGGYDANDTAALLSAAEEVFDFTHLKIGQPLRFYFDDGDDRAVRMEYDRNTEQMIVVERVEDEFTAREEDIAYDVTEETARGTIENFFYVDALDAGLSEATVLDVGDIFSFSIDFTTEIRQGDEFVFVYQKRTRDGEDAPDGYILASKFVNDGTAYYAYYYDNDGEGGYYDGDGHALERQFLKAPLSYRQITSGFTGARMHPITKTVTAHYQIDYAAPTGTPVVASARGTVVSAGWEGGWGNMIRMRHDNGYTTHYGHLSAFAKGITSGAQVAQGQVIGYVGSTGWSTGPHLDYGMKLNGAPINPLTLVQPKGAPLAEEKMNDFKQMKEKYAAILQ